MRPSPAEPGTARTPSSRKPADRATFSQEARRAAAGTRRRPRPSSIRRCRAAVHWPAHRHPARPSADTVAQESASSLVARGIDGRALGDQPDHGSVCPTTHKYPNGQRPLFGMSGQFLGLMAGAVELGPWAALLWGHQSSTTCQLRGLVSCRPVGRAHRGVESLPEPEVAVRGSHRLAPAGGLTG